MGAEPLEKLLVDVVVTAQCLLDGAELCRAGRRQPRVQPGLAPSLGPAEDFLEWSNVCFGDESREHVAARRVLLIDVDTAVTQILERLAFGLDVGGLIERDTANGFDHCVAAQQSHEVNRGRQLSRSRFLDNRSQGVVDLVAVLEERFNLFDGARAVDSVGMDSRRRTAGGLQYFGSGFCAHVAHVVSRRL